MSLLSFHASKLYRQQKVAGYTDDDGNVTGLEVVVTPKQAQKIVYAQLKGQISVSLLPINYKTTDLQPIDENGFLDTNDFNK